MRLIDADALRETLGITGTEGSCEGCTHYAGGWIGCKDDLPLGDVCDMIDDAPTVDAIPVIRCKDCKFLSSVLCPMAHEEDGLTVFRNDIDDYCSRAERKK